MGQYLNKVLISWQRMRQSVMGDEYVSVEHLFLATAQASKSIRLRDLFREFGITRESFLQALVYRTVAISE